MWRAAGEEEVKVQGHERSCMMSRTAGTDLLSFSSSFSSLARRRETVSSCVVGLEGVLGTPIQSELPVRR
jgi:hypothetical protein